MPPQNENETDEKKPKKPKLVRVKNALNQPLSEDGVSYPPANQKLGEDGKPLDEKARVFEVTPERRAALGACVVEVE